MILIWGIRSELHNCENLITLRKNILIIIVHPELQFYW